MVEPVSGRPSSKGEPTAAGLQWLDAPESDDLAFESHSDKTILLVEDDDAVRVLVSRMLTRQRFNVIAFSSGSEAIEYIKSDDVEVDLLLTDVVMPKMSGKALSDTLHLARPGIKTIYMSGYSDEIIAKRGVLEVGAHLIAKPFTTAEIVRRIHSVLGMGVHKW
ncbi:MAG: two-component system, cell cycle sensor histidine kinase and response regulator CckA [Actinomycetota bacterium]|jgi:DNA-binding response OmpR family regulator|nr:two-component system, cell cycle sensor histidine kinase and response regulator CckA [Actinomycetota bacterium]